MSMNIFERAVRKKLRFKSSRGMMSTEDLFDLDLQTLDTLAKEVNREIKAYDEESFIEEKSPVATTEELRLEILKHVIKSKIAAKDAANKRASLKAKLDRLKQIRADKEDEALLQMDASDIDKEIASLEEELV